MMLDPGALGTLIIGLRSIDAEHELDARRPDPERPPGRPRRHLRAAVATSLRTLADRLEPAPQEPQPAR
jgi:hypothetical protein